MKRLIREPLVQFFILGAALVAASSLVPGRDVPRDDEIVISAGQIEHLAARYARTWQRPPTLEELQGLINEHVREEVAYREGMAIGLDRDDTIIRRRIRQKLDFIAVDISSLVDPTEEELAAYLADHPEDFRVEPWFTFVQVFLDPDKHGDELESDARGLLDVLFQNPSLDVSEMGDRILIAPTQEDISLQEIASMFGRGFSDSLVTLHANEGQDQWFGPIPSGYGLHLVQVVSMSGGNQPELEEIRDIVRREWENFRRIEAKDQFYTELLDRYEITVEWPELEGQGSQR
jgi:hypothetical protein